jgi:sulfate adenylyltransferase
MSKPHGGKLINRKINKDLLNTKNLTQFEINTNLAEDVLNIANGVFSPLEGFLCEDNLDNVIKDKRLCDDTPWTIPILLDLDKNNLKEGDSVILVNKEAGVKALLEIEDIFTYDKKVIAKEIYRTTETSHPGVANTYNMKDNFVGGKISLLESKKRKYDEYNLTPKETRFLFKEKGWQEIVAFQTRNPPHIGHEYVQKTALTFVDGLFINPIIGKKKSGDFRDDV